jgi:hypothetical protein
MLFIEGKYTFTSHNCIVLLELVLEELHTSSFIFPQVLPEKKPCVGLFKDPSVKLALRSERSGPPLHRSHTPRRRQSTHQPPLPRMLPRVASRLLPHLRPGMELYLRPHAHSPLSSWYFSTLISIPQAQSHRCLGPKSAVSDVVFCSRAKGWPVFAMTLRAGSS